MTDHQQILTDCLTALKLDGTNHHVPGDRRSVEERLEEAIAGYECIDPDTQTLIEWARQESDTAAAEGLTWRTIMLRDVANRMEQLAYAAEELSQEVERLKSFERKRYESATKAFGLPPLSEREQEPKQ